MIDFVLSPELCQRRDAFRSVARDVIRPISREYDEREHERPVKFWELTWAGSRQADLRVGTAARGDEKAQRAKSPEFRNLATIVLTEELC